MIPLGCSLFYVTACGLRSFLILRPALPGRELLRRFILDEAGIEHGEHTQIIKNRGVLLCSSRASRFPASASRNVDAGFPAVIFNRGSLLIWDISKPGRVNSTHLFPQV